MGAARCRSAIAKRCEVTIASRKGLLGVAVMVLLVGVGITAVALHRSGAGTATPAGDPEDEPVVFVSVEPLTPRPVRRKVSVVGSFFGKEEVLVSAKVEGRIARVHHDIGDVVHPGDVLLEIEPTEYRLLAEEARRSFELELARLGLSQLPPPDFDLTKLPSVARAQAQLGLSESLRERQRRLSAQSAASREDRERAETEFAVAEAGLRLAKLEAETTLAAARFRHAALESALQRLAETRIVVPASPPRPAKPGVAKKEDPPPVEYVVSQRAMAEGEMVRAMGMGGTPLFRLVIDRPLKLVANVPERHQGEVKVGQVARIRVEAYPGEEFVGKVERLNPAVDRESRTFRVEILVPNEDRRLAAGSFARAEILTHVDDAAPTVPEEAIVAFAGVTKVFVVEGERAKEVQVVRRGQVLVEGPGDRPRAWVEIEGPLSHGAQIVTSGQSKLVEGSLVRVRGAAAEPKTEDAAPTKKPPRE